ncbi:DegT/DnrJ/EryC1/StrS family aminotransferase [Agromyces sp. NPDC058064]|uniref:DegT/DnrJ/EryC1/StrS family aminotransferase n=1 Tax=Agromyces sp. NPDC058064 TaxID=3346322 RepID=UPI0036DEBD86
MRLNVPLLGEAELEAVGSVLATGFLTQGPRAQEFESLVAQLVATDHAYATSSATTGIHLALHACGVEPGDEVVVPDYSFPATANAVIQQGAVPVFVDIDPATFNMDPTKLEAAITDRTAAIMPVHAFGLPADMNEINAVAAARGLPVIEDAACALAATYRGAAAGALGTAGVFSFHPRKIITTGEGGMITTSDAGVAERIAVLRTHGAVRGDTYMSFVDAGYNYRLSDINAAIGIAQMERLDHILERRRSLAAAYDDRLAEVDGVTSPIVPGDRTHTFQSYVLMLDEVFDRDAVIQALKARDVETTLGTYSMHLQPYFRDRFAIADEALPESTRAHRQALTVPLYPQMTESDVDSVVDALRITLADSRSVRAD